MTTTVPAPAEVSSARRRELLDAPEMRKADWLLLVAVALLGTTIFGAVGVPILILALWRLNRIAKNRQLVRPWSVTLIAIAVMLDASPNFFGWGLDLFPAHDVPLAGSNLWGWGKLAEGSNYIDYNSTPLGGIENPAVKTIEMWGVLLMYPMRIAAAWGFLRMKRWGLQAMIYSSFFHMAFWVGYLTLYCIQFEVEAGASLFGPVGFWAIALPMSSCFVELPYLLMVNRRWFSNDEFLTPQSPAGTASTSRIAKLTNSVRLLIPTSSSATSPAARYSNDAQPPDDVEPRDGPR